jgi:hypothetical protein
MPRSLSEDIIRGRRAIAMAKRRLMDTSEWEKRLSQLFQEAGREPDSRAGVQPWMLWQWRRVSIPEWRKILAESIKGCDAKREAYSRWMLKDILLDPDYTEAES